MPQIIELDTPRLILRQWTRADRVPFAAINADPRVMACFPAPLSRAQSDAMAARCEAMINGRGWGFWAAEEKNSGHFIGFVGLHVPSAELPFSPCVEIGWRLAHGAWGKGLATEAARSALAFGFDHLQLSEVVSFTAVINRRSRAVMTRLGMREAGTFDHPHLPASSPLQRHCLYRLGAVRYHATQQTVA